MQRKFVTDLSLLIFLNILIKPFWIFGIDRTVQNVVGAENYGLYFSLFSFSFLLNILLDLGITNYNNRNIAQNRQLLSKHFSAIVVLRFLLGIFYILICLGIGLLIGYNLYQLKILLILAFNQFLASLVLYFRSNLEALYLFKTDSIISILDRLLMIIICSFLLWGDIFDQQFKIEWFIYAQSVSYGITALITFLLVARQTEFLKLNWNRPFFIMILKQSFPFALLILIMTIYSRVDSVLLERLLPDGTEQAGIYAQAYRLFDAFNILPYLFAVLLLPMFSRMIKLSSKGKGEGGSESTRNDIKEELVELVKLSFCMLMTPVLILSIGSFFYQNELMNLLYHEHTEFSSPILGILMFSFIGVSISYIFGTLLTANGNLFHLNLIATGSMLINVIMNFILIPKFLAFGAAIASLITQSLSAIIQLCLAVYLFKFNPNYKLIARLILFITGSILIAYLSKKLSFDWWSNFIIMMIVCLLWAFVTKLFNLKGMYKIVNSQ